MEIYSDSMQTSYRLDVVKKLKSTHEISSSTIFTLIELATWRALAKNVETICDKM